MDILTPPELTAALDDAIAGIRARGHELGTSKMFGSSGFKTSPETGSKVFVMVYRGRLVAKLPADRVTDLASTGQATAFDSGHGRPSREWADFLDISPEAVAAIAEEAHVFVSGIPADDRRV
jgi:hypothetical protein